VIGSIASIEDIGGGIDNFAQVPDESSTVLADHRAGPEQSSQHAYWFGGYYGYPGYAIILIATREALVVHITTAGTIAPTGVIAVTTERIIGADEGTGTDGATGAGITDRRNWMLSRLHRNTS